MQRDVTIKIYCHCKIITIIVEEYYTVEPLYNGYNWDQEFFCYSKVSFAQGLVVDHALLPIVVNCTTIGRGAWSVTNKTKDNEIDYTN